MPSPCRQRPQRVPPGSAPSSCATPPPHPCACANTAENPESGSRPAVTDPSAASSPPATPTASPPIASPPTATQDQTPAPDQAPASGPDSHPADDITLTTSATGLQDRLDQLEAQFDWLKGQLRQSQKLATLGTTSAMIAHELNNLLTPVVAYTSEALKGDDVDLMRLALTKTLERATAMREMVTRVVGLARHSDAVVKAVNVHEVAAESIACLGRDFGKDNIDVRIRIDPDLCVRANPNQLLQVMLNLVSNARQAMLGRHGKLVIEAEPVDGTVLIRVRDTGCGIAPENLDQIFDPFFSTKRNAEKPDQRGLGLGLPVCKDIIEELTGRIAVDSTPGQGTTFTVTLPAAE